MAENKRGFVLYADNLSVVKKLVEQDRINNTNNAGELFLIILEYVNDLNPTPVNFITEMTFEPIKLQLKRDLIKYEITKLKRSEAGLKGAKQKQAKLSRAKKPQANQAVIDKDNVTVTDTVIDKDIVKVKENKDALRFPFSSVEFFESWDLLVTQPKWKKKSTAALQASLNKLGRVNEQTAIKMIENTIAGGWQGLFEIKEQAGTGKMETFMNNLKIASNL